MAMLQPATLSTRSSLKAALVPPRGTSAAQASSPPPASSVASDLTAFILEAVERNPEAFRKALGIPEPKAE